MAIFIRPEIRADYEDIDHILEKAFYGTLEKRLVRELRKQPAFETPLSLLAIDADGTPVGYILYSPLHLKDNVDDPKLLALAPMAVLPAFQRQGIGTQLVKDGLSRAKVLGYSSVVVLGHADYYPRFGFVRASNFGLRCPWPVSEENWMAIELERNSLQEFNGMVIYPKPFHDLIN